MDVDSYRQLKPGFAYRAIELKISPARQAEKLDCCGIDPEIYGDFVDLTQFSNEAILAATKSGLSINGNVHASERLICNKRIALNQPLVMTGTITEIENVPRGMLIRSEFAFTLPDGSVPLRTERSSVRLNREPVAAGSGKRASPGLPDLSLYETVGICQFVPENVARYSSEGGNAIHYDPATAVKFGYRAPIAGGLMGVRSLMASLCFDDGPPNNLDMSIRFKRPMFWDDRLEIMARRREDGALSNLALVNNAGKVNIEADIAQLA